MSVIEALAQARRERLQRIAARAVAQRELSAPQQQAPVMSAAEAWRRQLISEAADERAWAVEIMGLSDGSPAPVRPPRVLEIQRATAEHFGVPVSELLTERRNRRTTRARHLAMYLAREMTLKTFPEIGRAFGGRDHSTVLHGVRRIEEKLPFDGELAADVAHIRFAVEGLHGGAWLK
jgi:chromosomal replication initiator protein